MNGVTGLTGLRRRSVLGHGFMGLGFIGSGVVGLGGSGLAMLGAGAQAATKAPRVPSFDTPAARFRAYMMMRGALDERLVIGYLSGSYFGVVGAEMTPLWDVIGVTFARYRKRPDGGYDGVTGEIAHFLDPVTGEAPGRFLNPYTGQWNADPHTNMPPTGAGTARPRPRPAVRPCDQAARGARRRRVDHRDQPQRHCRARQARLPLQRDGDAPCAGK
jgi:hypothetical protein